MKSLGIIKIEKIVAHKDGSCTIHFSGVTKEVKDKIKKAYGRKRFTVKLFNRLVIEGMYNYLKEDFPKLVKPENLKVWLSCNNKKYQNAKVT